MMTDKAVFGCDSIGVSVKKPLLDHSRKLAETMYSSLEKSKRKMMAGNETDGLLPRRVGITLM
jgi:hypothetical protein